MTTQPPISITLIETIKDALHHGLNGDMAYIEDRERIEQTQRALEALSIIESMGADVAGEIPPASTNLSSREISVVDEPAEILKAIADYKAQWKTRGVVIDINDVNSFVGGWTARAEAFPSTREPVSGEVSLKKCIEATAYCYGPSAITKAVLDAAGVKYVD